jgi:HEAT repeat protein
MYSWRVEWRISARVVTAVAASRHGPAIARALKTADQWGKLLGEGAPRSARWSLRGSGSFGALSLRKSAIRVCCALGNAFSASSDLTDRSRTTDVLARTLQARMQHDIGYLVSALRDPEARTLAAKYLAELNAGEAIGPLTRMLMVRDPHSRAAAASALGRLKADAAVEALISIAENDPERFVREWAIGALARINHPEGTGALIALLSDPNRRIRRWTATALGSSAGLDAVDALERARSREPWFRTRPYRRAIRSIRRRSRDAS